MEVERIIARLAAPQLGLLTRSQLLVAGVSRRCIERRLRTGQLVRVFAGVYRVAAAPSSWEQAVLAACLAAGDGARASGLCAAVFHGLVDRRRTSIEVTVPSSRRPRGNGFDVRRSRSPLGAERVGAVPVTTVPPTLADIATVVDASVLEEAVDSALRRRLVTIEDLAKQRSAVLAKLIADRGGPVSGSVLETRVRRILIDAGLPAPVRQHEVRRGGDLIARVDLAYPHERIAIELDGFEHHSSKRAFERDRRRQNELQSAGFVVLRFTWSDLARPRSIVSSAKRLLFERGHPDVVSL